MIFSRNIIWCCIDSDLCSDVSWIWDADPKKIYGDPQQCPLPASNPRKFAQGLFFIFMDNIAMGDYWSPTISRGHWICRKRVPLKHYTKRGDFLYTFFRNSKRCFLGLLNIGHRMLNPEYIFFFHNFFENILSKITLARLGLNCNFTI